MKLNIIDERDPKKIFNAFLKSFFVLKGYAWTGTDVPFFWLFIFLNILLLSWFLIMNIIR